jgi:hypothetical protein
MSKKKPEKAKKSPAPGAPPKTPVSEITADQQIVGAVFLGKVKDYFSEPGAIFLILEASLSLGDTLRIKGHTTDLTQKVESLQVNRVNVQSAVAGDPVSIKVADRARIGDAVYKC